MVSLELISSIDRECTLTLPLQSLHYAKFAGQLGSLLEQRTDADAKSFAKVYPSTDE
jgi:hypothetical protein